MTKVREFTESFKQKCADFKAIINLDKLGIFVSSLCLIHCTVLPFAILFLPFLGLKFLESNIVHKALAGFVFIFAFTAIVPGYIEHRNIKIFTAMTTGLILVLFATFYLESIKLEYLETPVITLGNIILIVTHLANRRLLAKLHNIDCCPDHSHS